MEVSNVILSPCQPIILQEQKGLTKNAWILPTLHLIMINIESSVMCLLQDCWPILEVPGLSMMPSSKDALVPEDGPGVDSRSSLYQVSDPGVAWPWVGDQGPGWKAVSDTEPCHELVTGSLTRPELMLRSLGVPGYIDHNIVRVFYASNVIMDMLSSILHHLWSDMHIMILIRMSVKSSENTNQNTVTDSVINFLIWWKKLTTKST